MKSGSTFLGVFLVFLMIVAFVHLFAQFAFYGTGYEGFAEKGITGLAVDDTDSDGGLPISEMILFLEWGLILLGVIFVYVKYNIDLKKELGRLSLVKEKKHFFGGTQLDNFYGLLKEIKHFRLSNAAKVFDVNSEVIEDWAQSLETAKVAELAYPRIGGPEIRLIEGACPVKSGDDEEDEENGDEKEKEESESEEDKKVEKERNADKLREKIKKVEEKR